MTLLTCSYNSAALVKNWWSCVESTFGNFVPKVIVCENSDDPSVMAETVPFLEGRGARVVVNEGSNRRHATGVRMLIPMVSTRYALLVDTDTEVRKSPVDLMSEMESIPRCAAAGFYGKRSPHHVNRVHPWYMLFRADIAIAEGFFFNCEKTEEQDFIPLFESNRNRAYDVGCRFFEELEHRKYAVLQINGRCSNYNDTPWYYHHEGLSWCNRRSDPLMRRRRMALARITERIEGHGRQG